MTVSEVEAPVVPILWFSPRDLEGVSIPHNDTLIIQAIVATYEVARVFVDVRSSIKVFFCATWEEMGIEMEIL